MPDDTTEPNSILSQDDRDYLTDREQFLQDSDHPYQKENGQKNRLKNRVNAGIIDSRLLTERLDNDRLKLEQIFDGDELLTSGLVYMFAFAYRGLLEQGYSRENIENLIGEAIEHQDPEVSGVEVSIRKEDQNESRKDIDGQEAYLKFREGSPEDLTVEEIDHLLFGRDQQSVNESV